MFCLVECPVEKILRIKNRHVVRIVEFPGSKRDFKENHIISIFLYMNTRLKVSPEIHTIPVPIINEHSFQIICVCETKIINFYVFVCRIVSL